MKEQKNEQDSTPQVLISFIYPELNLKIESIIDRFTEAGTTLDLDFGVRMISLNGPQYTVRGYITNKDRLRNIGEPFQSIGIFGDARIGSFGPVQSPKMTFGPSL